MKRFPKYSGSLFILLATLCSIPETIRAEQSRPQSSSAQNDKKPARTKQPEKASQNSKKKNAAQQKQTARQKQTAQQKQTAKQTPATPKKPSGSTEREKRSTPVSAPQKSSQNTAPIEAETPKPQQRQPAVKPSGSKTAPATQKKSTTQNPSRGAATFVDRDGDGIRDGQEHRFRRQTRHRTNAGRGGLKQRRTQSRKQYGRRGNGS